MHPHYRSSGSLDMRFKSSRKEMARRQQREWRIARAKLKAWEIAGAKLPKAPAESMMQCMVCLAPVEKFHAKFLPCAHGFHARCIDRWVETLERQQATPRCPMCKAEIEL